jgi:mRNA interferase RelE/StbE
MMDYRVFLHPKAEGIIRKLGNELRDRLMEKIRELKTDPESKGERLKGSVFYKLRVGDYRIIYEIRAGEKTVVILFIGPRNKVYDDFEKFL